MKFFLIAALLSALATAQTESAPPNTAGGTAQTQSQSAPADQENQNKAKALLNQMIQALGGNAYLNVDDMTQEGRGYSFHLGRPTSAGIVFWRFYKYPDKDRIELTKKRDIIEVFNGQKGFEITYKGTRHMEAKDLTDYLRRQQYALDAVLRKWINEPGVALFYEGSAVADQKQAEQVTIMNAHDQAVTLYMDINTHLPIKKTFSWRDPTDKQRNLEEEVYDNYKPVQGVMTPFVVTRYYNGDMSNQRFITSVEYNKGLKTAMFDVDPANSPKTRASSK